MDKENVEPPRKKMAWSNKVTKEYGKPKKQMREKKQKQKKGCNVLQMVSPLKDIPIERLNTQGQTQTQVKSLWCSG